MASLVRKYGWYEWLTHTNYSFLKGASHPADYINRAHSLGYKGIGICDYDGVYGIVKAYSALKEAPSKNLKIFYGSEIHLACDHDLPLLYQDTIVLYALNIEGYRNLCRILSLSHKDSKDRAFLPLSKLVHNDLSHLVALQPMRGLVRQGSSTHMVEKYRLLKEALPKRFFLIISRHLHPSEDYWIKPTADIAKKLSLPTLFSQDAFFYHAKEKDLSDLVQAIRMNLTLNDAVPYMFANSERSFKNITEIEARYQSLPLFKVSMENSQILAESFNFCLKELRYQYPKEFIPEGMCSQSYLKHLVWKNAMQKYPKGVPSHLHKLLTKELDLVEYLDFADYFLTVWDIVRWAQQQNILCQGRGSAANSAICFILNITAVDPTKFDLLFERFISVERGDPPDIDVDFEHERREEVIQYIYNHYGRDRSAMVANIITFRSKGAIRATGKALGIPEEVLNQASSLQKYQDHRKKNDIKKIDALETPSDPIPWKVWLQMSEKLKGFPRHMGLHSGGFVLTDSAIDTFVPREPATMTDRTIVQWNKDDLETLGFFKIDILALGMLTAIRKSISMINTVYNAIPHHPSATSHKGSLSIPLSITDIPQDDLPTYQMIQKADTVGTFQIESRAQMSMLPKLRPEKFYDLVVQVGIIRPGPIQGGLIHPYLKRRHGLEPITYAHPKLIPILKRTNGVPIFQEQVMRIAMEVGDFTAGEADQLRKQIGSWAMKKDLDTMIEKLERGMRINNISDHFIEQTLGQLRGFAEYGFPESHAVSFALIAYASSWIKCHYPAAFFAALLNSQPMGFYSRHALIQAAKRAKVNIRKICINYSKWDAHLESDNQSFAIRLGFNMVKGLRKKGINDLIEKRKTIGTWQNFDHFINTVSIHRGDLTALTSAGALESLNIERRAALWVAEAIPLAPFIEEELIHQFPEESMLDKVERDFETTGTSLEIHPAHLIKKDHWPYQIPTKRISMSKDLAHLPRNLIVTAFGMVLVKQAPYTAKGMVFITMEDEQGHINLAFTPQVYDKFHETINGQSFLCAEGRLQKEGESHSIMVKKVFYPAPPDAEVMPLTNNEIDIEVTSIPLTKTRNYM